MTRHPRNEKSQGNGPAPIPLAKVLQLSKSTRPPPGERSGPASPPGMTAESLDPEDSPRSLYGDERHASRGPWTDDCNVHIVDPRERTVKSLCALQTASG